MRTISKCEREASASGHTWPCPTAACQGCVPGDTQRGEPWENTPLPRTEVCQRGSRWHRMIPPHRIDPGFILCRNMERLCEQCLNVLQAPFQPWHSLAVELAAEWMNELINSRCGLTHVCAYRAMGSNGEDSLQLNWVPAQTLTKEEIKEVLWVFFRMLWYFNG